MRLHSREVYACCPSGATGCLSSKRLHMTAFITTSWTYRGQNSERLSGSQPLKLNQLSWRQPESRALLKTALPAATFSRRCTNSGCLSFYEGKRLSLEEDHCVNVTNSCPPCGWISGQDKSSSDANLFIYQEVEVSLRPVKRTESMWPVHSLPWGRFM